ncbi:hypothetical protein SAMN05421827_101144 [Pedobacter terrae]|uniref:Uncharacterized protein n=1 Tax=Pedobacter terrae TaxID=405671 RepID=A0A1G7MYZ4_9SPHI|nr:hypothetical protein SAMN05421827_101144 [Pedobacter terrae]
MGIWCMGSKFFKYWLIGNYLSRLSNSKLPALNSKPIPAAKPHTQSNYSKHFNPALCLNLKSE